MPITKKRPIRTVENGTGWHITYDPANMDFAAHIDGVGVVGYRKAKGEARELILDIYCDEQAIANALKTVATPPGQPVPPPRCPTYRKEIAYDYETRDYAMYLNGELTGFARTYHEAETALDQLVFELLNGARETTHTPDPEDNHRCGDCGAALSEFGLCESCLPERVITRPLTCESCERTEHETVFSLTLLLDEGKLILCDACHHKAYSAEPEPGIADSQYPIAESPIPNATGLDKPLSAIGLSSVGYTSCPSCDASTPAPGTCPACRVEATALLHSDELTFSQYVALAAAGAG